MVGIRYLSKCSIVAGLLTKKFETRVESNSSSHIKVENGCLVNYNSLGSIKPAIKAELYNWVQ